MGKGESVLFDGRPVVESLWTGEMIAVAEGDIWHEPRRPVGITRGRDGSACSSHPRYVPNRVGAGEARHLPRLSQSAVHSDDAGDGQHCNEDALCTDQRHGHVNCHRRT